MKDYKAYVVNYNGVLDGVEDALEAAGNLTDNYHEADIFLIWQDVRGECLQLANIVKHSLKKPLIVMQHGRGAVRDYGSPNNLRLLADKILVWGESERQRLLSYGIENLKIEVVGCPLIRRLRPKNKKREGKNILFTPVIAEKEEPENVIVYNALRIWEAQKMIARLYREFPKFKKAWAWEINEMREVTLPNGEKEQRLWKKEIKRCLPRWLTYSDGLINVKLTSVHDVHQYQSPLIVSNQNDPCLIDNIAELLSNIDVMVCLEEGTMQLLACALDIPVICADIFKYGNYGGCPNYDDIEKINTKACYHIKDISKLGKIIDHALANPAELRQQRIKVVEEEGSPQLGDCDAHVIGILESCVEWSRSGTVTGKEVVKV